MRSYNYRMSSIWRVCLHAAILSLSLKTRGEVKVKMKTKVEVEMHAQKMHKLI